MKRSSLVLAFLVAFLPFLDARAQVPSETPELRPAPSPFIDNKPQQPSVTLTPPVARPLQMAPLAMTPSMVHAKLAEAQRLLKSRPHPTSFSFPTVGPMTGSTIGSTPGSLIGPTLGTTSGPAIDVVTLTAFDHATSRIHLVTMYKPTFLTKGAEVTMTSTLGTPLTIRIVRANGVNTAVTIFDDQGRSLSPLVVQYPIERGGVFREMAYYTSVHPAIFSPELARSGQTYVRTMIDLAAKRLREKGVFVSPQIIDVAERLCLVEHVDHDRFRLENRHALFQEIYSLFALNQLDTYRYSVSSAGAGGMVQMIPWAYNLMRQRHPGVGLIPDFVVGMRNHANALQAMLLYMQDTWNDLVTDADVQYALAAKLATQPELLAAGYNSNAARLPGYIRRGGSSWRYLIPRETQMYLQIYKTFEGLVPIKSRLATTNEAVD